MTKENVTKTTIEQLQEKMKISLESHESQVKHLTQVQNSIKQLAEEEKKVAQSINTLAGSFNAYQEALKILQEEKI